MLKPAIALFGAREYRKAAVEFERVYTTTNEPGALFWMGRALQESGQLAGALRAYQRYWTEAAPSTLPNRGTDLIGTIQTLTMQVAIVTVTAPVGATISVDGIVAGTMPLAEPLYLDPGKRTITATSGGATDSKVIDAAEEARLSVDLLSAPTPAVAAVSAPTEPTTIDPTTPPPSSGIGGLKLAGLGVATLIAAGSVYFAVKAAGTASDFASTKASLGSSRGDIDALQSETRLQAGVSVALAVGALGLAGVTLFALKSPRPDKAASGRSRFVVTGRGVSLAGSF